jgi:hypothetical protein
MLSMRPIINFLSIRENWLLLAEHAWKSKFWQKSNEKNRNFFQILAKVI